MQFDVKKLTSQLKDRLSQAPELDERQLTVLAAAGTVLVCSAVHSIHRRMVMKRTVAKELKKQLAPVHKKLDSLQAENAQLRKELAQAEKKEH